MNLHTLAPLAALGLLVAACGTGPEDYDDVATTISNLMTDQSGELSLLEDAQLLMAGNMPAGMAMEDGVVRGARGQVAFELRYQCRNPDGQLQTECSAMTESAGIEAGWRGIVQTARHYAKIERTASWSFRHMTTDVALLDGSTTNEVDSRFTALYRPIARRLELSASGIYADVHVDSAKRIPIAGTVRYDAHAKWRAVSGDAEIERERDIDVLISFAPSGDAAIELDGDRRYRLDIPTGRLALEE